MSSYHSHLLQRSTMTRVALGRASVPAKRNFNSLPSRLGTSVHRNATSRRSHGSKLWISRALQPQGDGQGREIVDVAEKEWQGELQPVRTASHGGPANEDSNNPISNLGARWDAVPGRYKAVIATSMAFILANMDKVNISIAIIPMSQDFGWSPTVTGIVQSSFFYGYLLSQIPGGYMASRLGGRTVLSAGVTIWSVATGAVPVLAATVPGLFISRAAVGLGEGVAPSSATDIVARVIDPKERSRAISFIFGGLHVGSLLGLIVAPVIIENFGWPVVFYLFGGLGLVWALWWERLMGGIKESEPELAKLLSDDTASGAAVASVENEEDAAHAMGGHGGHGGVISHTQAVPWRAFLRNRPVQALAYTHFCNNWFHYTMLAWLPTYFTQSLSLDLVRAAQVSILPPAAAILVSAIAGPTADSLIERGVDVGTVRKASQAAAFLGPALCLGAVCVTESGPATVALISVSLGLASFSLAGLYCNHADLSPKYAPVLLGLTNTCGAIPGIMGVTFTGILYDKTSSWEWSLFLPSIFFFLTGSLVFALNGSAERQEFSNNEPFGAELWWKRLWSGLSGEQKDKEE